VSHGIADAMKNGRLIQSINRKENIVMIQQTQSVPQPGQQSAAPAQKEHMVVAGESLEQIARNCPPSAELGHG
jgi:LysM repeat protein